jgi:hypothetical protein
MCDTNPVKIVINLYFKVKRLEYVIRSINGNMFTEGFPQRTEHFHAVVILVSQRNEHETLVV